MNWAIMPVLDCLNYTLDALGDVLAQSVPVRVLVINQGSTDETREALERYQEQHSQVLVWHHDPPLPSLSATWNRALDFVWEVGGTEALVVNNDVRLHHCTVQVLSTVRTCLLYTSDAADE